MSKGRRLRGIGIRVGLAFLLSIAAGVALFVPAPGWVRPVTMAFHKPVMAAWYLLLPSQDSYPPFTPYALYPGFLIYLAFSVGVWVALSYAPTALLLVWRSTREACRTPLPFLVYAVVGGLLGGLLAFWLWASFTVVGSQSTMQRSVLFGSISLGWVLAIWRCDLERRHARRG